jgi:glycosyltransferase involved in cell wall biosynthesis
MKISVVIPVFNGEKWVAQCVENMLAQSHKDLEVIVVDDGSTDRSAEIAARYPVTLLRQPNSGVSAARNRGLAEATGDYIHFMDVDDSINLDYYAHMAAAVECTGAELAYGGWIHEALPGLTHLYTERWLVSVAEDKFGITNILMQGGASRFIVSRALLERIGLRFDESHSHGEDTLFSIQALHEAGSVVTVPGAEYCYKFRSTSAMRNRDARARRARKKSRSRAKAARMELMREYGLGAISGVRVVERVRYKVLGIPVLEKRIYNVGKARWFLFGLRILQVKQLGQSLV